MKAERIQYNEQKKEINKHIMKTEEFVKDFKIENISKSNAFTLSWTFAPYNKNPNRNGKILTNGRDINTLVSTCMCENWIGTPSGASLQGRHLRRLGAVAPPPQGGRKKEKQEKREKKEKKRKKGTRNNVKLLHINAVFFKFWHWKILKNLAPKKKLKWCPCKLGYIDCQLRAGRKGICTFYTQDQQLCA